MTSTPLADLRDSFMIELRAQHLAAGTLTRYGQAVDLFARWLVDNGHPADVASLTRGNITSWLAEQSARLKRNTVRNRYKGLARFCRFLLDEGEIDEHPMRTIEIPKAEAPLVPVFDDDDLAALIKACTGKRWQDRRDEAIVRVLTDCGIRIGELRGLTVDGLDLRRERAIVMGKGDKERPIYFSPRTTRALDRWVRARRSHPRASSPALFLSERGALSDNGVRWILRQRVEQAGLDGRANPHRFRHTWAHDFLLAGGQQGDLKQLAGWTSDVMLARYGASAADVRAMEAARRMRRGDRI